MRANAQAEAVLAAQGLGHTHTQGCGDAPLKDFAICGLDVISGMCEGMQEHFVTLVVQQQQQQVQSGQSSLPLLDLMFICLADPLDELRQSAFALAGEICKVGRSVKWLVGVLVDHGLLL
jgi:transportin-1